MCFFNILLCKGFSAHCITELDSFQVEISIYTPK